MTQDWTATPDLDGSLVRLTAVRAEHAPGLLAAADSDDVFSWMPVVRPASLAEAEALVQRYVDWPGVHVWTQLDARTGEPVGVTSFYEVSADLQTVAIGHTWLASRAWRTGINTESKLLLLTHAFETLGAVRVVWHTDDRNQRSQAAILRLGATHEGVLRKHRRRTDGSWRDTWTFSMLDTEWPDAKYALQARLARA
ncbi:GNAT family N-acetyltransferase [Aeromicrobium sp. Root495]|uniref:GNAT family N-acetyltransferase n=1 Tax=Aeromicrobium sp. Root495 TaxID=1736550 RepID=UPI000A5B1116|nr:GNAT family protein [Aeromicrobium sp. Root495]